MKSSSIFTLFIALSATLLSAAEPESKKPNIVVILADDLGCGDLSLYDGWVKTPRIDQMAKEGLTFKDFHTNSSVCSPTRVAFLTGRYQQRAGVVDVIVGSREENQGLQPSMPTITRVFKDNGYQTALFGKWHCGYQDKYNPVHHGFDEFIGFLNGGSDYHKHGAWRVGLKKQDVPGYTTHIITDKSIDFIKRNKEKPFFLYISHAAVHNPYHTPQDTPENRVEGWKHSQINPINREKYKVILEELDKGVGQVLDTLVELDIAENTLVFFFSDNGAVGMSPKERPFRGGKYSQYEGGHRVPAVAWWPGKIKPGSVSDELVIGFDLFPTFTDIAGISKDNPASLDGVSAKEHLLQQKDFPARDIFFGYEPKLGTAMRRGQWKMIMKEDIVELYNLKNDIKETTNVAKKHLEISKSMQQAIEEFKAKVTPGS